jgi:hypothetical protein
MLSVIATGRWRGVLPCEALLTLCREEKDGFLARVAAEGGVELPKVNDSIAANPSIHSCVARTRTMARSLHHTGDRTTDDGQLSLESNACVNGSIAASG